MLRLFITQTNVLSPKKFHKSPCGVISIIKKCTGDWQMKRRNIFILKCYAAVFLFVVAAYIIAFQQQHWANKFLAYNLSERSDVYPTLERYVVLLSSKNETKQVSEAGFHRFLMPVEGSVIVNFNEKMHSGKGEYILDGVVLKCQPGSQVIAGDDGTITDVRFSKGIGWYVDIYHGSGIYSRYGNLTKIINKKGAKIKRGENIAKVADTFEGRVYLQLFINGKAVNPVTATLMKKGI